jgi:phosphoinositide-3-kinase regulatory subunit 4
MIKHMIQIDPKKRLSAEEYLSEWHSKAFPHYFYSFLYPYMSSLNEKIDYQQQKQNDDPTILSALSSAYPSFNSRKLTDADEKIERVFYDFEKILDFISKPNDGTV